MTVTSHPLWGIPITSINWDMLERAYPGCSVLWDDYGAKWLDEFADKLNICPSVYLSSGDSFSITLYIENVSNYYPYALFVNSKPYGPYWQFVGNAGHYLGYKP